MARDKSGDSTLTDREVRAMRQISGKCLGASGHPRDKIEDTGSTRPSQPTAIVSEDEETGLIDPLKGK